MNTRKKIWDVEYTVNRRGGGSTDRRIEIAAYSLSIAVALAGDRIVQIYDEDQFVESVVIRRITLIEDPQAEESKHNEKDLKEAVARAQTRKKDLRLLSIAITALVISVVSLFLKILPNLPTQ